MVMDAEKFIFDDDSEFDQIWWKCCQHSVELVGQVSSAFERNFSRKAILKNNDSFHLNGGNDLIRLHIDQLTFQSTVPSTDSGSVSISLSLHGLTGKLKTVLKRLIYA